MQIPAIPDYNSLIFSGCSMNYANFITRKRLYNNTFEVDIVNRSIFMVFPFDFTLKNGTSYPEYIGFNTFQLLKIQDDIDNESFLSLN